MLADYRWQFLGRCNAQLFVNTESAKHNFNILDGYSKFFCQESNHMVSCSARHWRGRDADLELIAFNLADSVLLCTGLPEDIKH